MVALPYKAKQYGWFALKVCILAVAFYFILQKLLVTEGALVQEVFRALSWERGLSVASFFFLAGLNWYLEILKWKVLASTIKKITFWDALRQSLAALTVSLATPQRLGDYAAKALFYEPHCRKRILLLNFFHQGSQMAITLIMGLLGLVLSKPLLNWSIAPSKFFGWAVVLLFIGVLFVKFRNKQLLLKGLTIRKILNHAAKIPLKRRWRIAILSLLRYLVFSTLFYLLLRFFGAENTIWEVYPLLMLLYLLVSMIPVFLVADVIVRGSVAVWLFSFIGLNELTVLSTVLVMWLLNFMLPALWGSFYVIKWQPK